MWMRPADTILQMKLKISEEAGGLRLDQALSRQIPEHSRARIQQWIRDGAVLVDGVARRAKDRVYGGEMIEIDAAERMEQTGVQPQNLPIECIHADEDLIVIDKVAGMVVHPAAGHFDGTLQNALLYHFPELAAVPRAGIVHRLDKDTSGLMVVARSLHAHTHLVNQLQSREMGREYEAVVHGVMVAGGTVDAPIGRHPVDRKRMAVVSNGKPAVTHYRLAHKFASHTHLRIKLQTGRTHQIRVHMAHIRYPIVGDPVYGGRKRIPAAASEQLIEALRSFPRQALHAARLELNHPVSEERLSWQSALPDDMQQLLQQLKHDAGE